MAHSSCPLTMAFLFSSELTEQDVLDILKCSGEQQIFKKSVSFTVRNKRRKQAIDVLGSWKKNGVSEQIKKALMKEDSALVNKFPTLFKEQEVPKNREQIENESINVFASTSTTTQLTLKEISERSTTKTDYYTTTKRLACTSHDEGMKCLNLKAFNTNK